MNDFTKEELGQIFLDINHNILKHGIQNVDPWYLDLRDKVESMIDNYCEHENDISESIYPQKECKKCNKIVFGDFICPWGKLNDNQ